VPFHIGKHKPTAAKQPLSRLKARLQIAACAAIFLSLGLFRLSGGVVYVINWDTMPVFSGALITTGVALILLAACPFSWIEKIAHRRASDLHSKNRVSPE
jgi:hypothetical protein